MGDTFQPFYQAWVRSLIIMAMMLPFMLISKSFRRIDREDFGAFVFFILACVCTQVPLYFAYNHAPIGVVLLVFYATFIIACYLTGKLYLNEVVSKVKLIALGTAFAGLLVVFGTSVFVFAPLGIVLAMFNGAASGIETTSTKRITTKYPPPWFCFMVGWRLL